MESSFRIARIGGIEIGASWTWLIIVGIVVWSLATALFPATYPDLDAGVHLAMALVTAVLFFASILLHELGHARRAVREGVPIEGITLWLFGGVARLRGNPPSAGAAFRVAALGPAVSALLALGFAAAAYAGSELGVHESVQGVVDYLARINAIVLAFNLVPALPLDGGRILQAWIWHRTGRFTESTIQAATAGRAFGYVLIAVGLLGIFGGTGLGGLWIAFIGWFLVQAAGTETVHALIRRALGATRVRDTMEREPATVPPDLSVTALLDEAWRTRRSSYPVVADGELVGMVTARAAGRVPTDERSQRRVADVMTARQELTTVDPDQELATLIETGAFAAGDELAVTHDGRLAGLVARSDVARAIELGEARPPGPAGAAPGRRGAGPLVWIVVGLAILAAAGFLYYPPFVVLSPGETLPVEDDISIDGVSTTAVDGDYRLTAVRIDRTNALGTVLAWVRPDRDVLPIGEVVPRGVDVDEYTEQQQEVFDESRRLAAVAGARAAGHAAAVDGDGARIVGVLPDSPADDVVERGDVIVAVDGTPVPTSTELRDVLRGHRAGARITLTVEREGGADRDEIDVRTAALPDLGGEAGLGVLVTTEDLTADLPFDVSFGQRDIGGPSAGLVYALAVADILSEDDLADGRIVAATGTISVDGDVGPVGAVDLKAIAAGDAGADVFLTPERDASAARGEDDLDVRAVRNLDEALQALA